MTIISHRYRFIFIKTHKTAGTSIEQWLAPHLGWRDLIATAPENRVALTSLLSTPDASTPLRRFEPRAKRWIWRTFQSPIAFGLGEHMPAEAIRAVVGDEVWNSYFKFCVDRQPWDRLLSLWRWRQKRYRVSMSFDEFLDLIEHRPEEPFTKYWNNRLDYMIGGTVVVDRLVRFENLIPELTSIGRELAIPASISDLPQRKGDLRKESDRASLLTAGQIDRIARICREEIEYFGWEIPKAESVRTGRV